MTRELMQRELVIDLATGEFQVLPITDPRIIGPADYGWVRFQEARSAAGGQPAVDLMTWGGGPYISHRIGADFVCIKGRAPEDSVLILNHRGGQISVRLEPIDPDVIWPGYAPADPEQDNGEEYLIGFYALQQAVLDRYKGEYIEDWVRVFAVGPAARHTDQGVIGSNQVRKGRILPIDDWAGRGGLGSQLLQRHRIAACIFGGDWEDPDLKDSKEIDGYFMANYGQSMIFVIREECD